MTEGDRRTRRSHPSPWARSHANRHECLRVRLAIQEWFWTRWCCLNLREMVRGRAWSQYRKR